MAAPLALDVILASFFHCRLTIQLFDISDPAEKFNALVVNHAGNPWPYMVITHAWPNDMNFRLLDNRGTCILHTFLTSNGKISQVAPDMHWWSVRIMHQTYYLSVRVAQTDTSLLPWSTEFRAADFVDHIRVLENWALVNVVLGSNDVYVVERISAMYFYCSRHEVICLKSLLLSTPHDKLFSQMFPLSWPAGSLDYKQWPIHFLTSDEWLLKGESKVDKLTNPLPARLLLPKAPHTAHIFELGELSDLLLHFNASLTVSWEPPEYSPLTYIRMELIVKHIEGYSVFQGVPQVGFVYCNNKTSPHHYIYSIASPLDWPTWACAAGTYVAMCVTVRMISGQWQPLNLFISFLAQGASLCLKRLRAVWLLWIITAVFFGWFFTSSIESLLVSPTLPTGINDMEGLLRSGYRLVLDAWSDEGILLQWEPDFMSETAVLRDLKASALLGQVWNIYDQYFLNYLRIPKRALVLQQELVQVLLNKLQEQFDGKQCFGNPSALSLYPVAMVCEGTNGRMVRDAAIRLKEAGLGVWYEKNRAESRVYEWELKFNTNLKAAFTDEVKDNGLVSGWNTEDALLEGFHRTTDGNELTALLVICSTALALAFALFIAEIFYIKMLVLAKMSALLKSVWRWATGLAIWIE